MDQRLQALNGSRWPHFIELITIFAGSLESSEGTDTQCRAQNVCKAHLC
jgi:hypothetical protein